ncbi:hypothetical protein CXB51_030891 [Gossypium anomalum]|uniref:Uncharacterized protein n=1 Tax=Gossypium anomalum TaxID=47600 RepID=A0A8J5YCL7_9ROSI|nr:hypothetical protein CXB51_030891 [Gossypium anomalum]
MDWMSSHDETNVRRVIPNLIYVMSQGEIKAKRGGEKRFVDMGSEEDKILESKMKGSKKTMNTFMACLWSFLVSLGGSLLLAWWEYQYHPTNRQLWMVPFGLILFFTPLIVWFAIFVSDIFSLTPDVTQPAASIHHPEKLSKQRVQVKVTAAVYLRELPRTNGYLPESGILDIGPRPRWKPSGLCDSSKCHKSNMKESNRDIIDAKAFTLTAIIEIDAQAFTSSLLLLMMFGNSRPPTAVMLSTEDNGKCRAKHL